MKIYDGSSNLQDKQIQSGCTYVMFEVTKGATTGYASLFDFFNENSQASADTLNLTYNDAVRGQVSLISSLHVLPLFLMSSVAPNAIQAVGKLVEKSKYKIDPVSLVLSDKEGKEVVLKPGEVVSHYRGLGVAPSLQLTSVRAVLRVGFGGAVPLNQNNYLSLSTNFSDLVNLKVYALDGRKTNMIMRYESAILQPGMNTEVTFVNSLSAAIPKIVDQATIQTLPAADSPAYSAVYSEKELEVIARDSDPVVCEVGCEDFINVVPPTGGTAYSYPLGFRSEFTMANGYGYDVIPTANYDNAKITTQYGALVFVSRAYGINELTA